VLLGQRAGYSPDIVMRMVVESLRRELDHPLIVENKPGAFSRVMMQELMRSTPDGYTIAGVFWHQMSAGPALTSNLGFDPLEDLTHLGIWGHGTQVIVTAAESRLRTIAELRDRARTATPPLQIGVSGLGSPGHVFSAMMQREAGFRLEAVALRGTDIVASVLRGDVPVAIGGVDEVVAFAKDPRLVPLAVLADVRVRALPQTPTLAEAGIPWSGHAVWAGFVGPRGIPADVVAAFNQALVRVAADADLVRRLDLTGRVLAPTSPEGMRDRIRREIPLWREIIQAAGITIG
jgi:tripartite-type tricarboxylate transporter receptor subunit TctC